MKLGKIAEILDCSITTEASHIEIERISAPEKADSRSITFLSNPRYMEAIRNCEAPAVIVTKGVYLEGKIVLEVDDPYVGYALIAQQFEDKSAPFGSGIHQSAIVDSTAIVHPSVSIGPCSVIGRNCVIGANTIIGALCVIEKDTEIGEDCRIDSGVVIRYGTKIGSRVIIQSSAVIGSDGFGNARKNGKWIRIPSFGNVVVEDGAEIGASSTVDRGAFASTTIGKGVKLDNLIHIAHNVVVGEDTAMAAQSGVSGSTEIGKRVIIGGQAGFVGHIKIGDDAFIGAKAGVSKDVAAGAKVTGYPARQIMQIRRIEAAQLSLPSLLKEVKKMRLELEELKKVVKHGGGST